MAEWSKLIVDLKWPTTDSSDASHLLGDMNRLESPPGDLWAILVEKNVTSRVKKTSPLPGGHAFLPIRTIFKLNCCIEETYIVKTNVSSRLFTCFHSIHIEKTVPPPGDHVFQMMTTIFELVRNIHKANVMTKFHDDCVKNVPSRVNMPPLGRPCFLRIRTIFELKNGIQEPNLLSKFHEDWAKNVSSRLLTENYRAHKLFLLCKYKEHDPLAALLPIQTIFELNRHIEETNVLTKFHEDWIKNVSSRVGHVLSPIWTNFELVRDINDTNVLTKFQDDWANIVTSRVFTMFLYSHIMNTSPPPGTHISWASNVTSSVFTVFELDQDIIGTNLLTKFHADQTRHADQTIHVATRVFTRQNINDERRTTDDARRTKGDPKSSHEHVVLT
ncbi:hypothetical protein DPMN_102042 [Dreissena polymorpha]|uniref:Uncharacterized protein n=1 Tax=Dreissena polymorpha TaxID=45954 RepID=A0A9D4LK52_DREPO|nr:hypothetical protein DPMN_102042 [Dreissena polymorpha]